eukprot:3694580-Rhodomonas_salina.1
MHRSTRGKRLVFAAINRTQANLCMASDKEKDKDKKSKAAEKLLLETAAKKKKDDEEAQVAASFLEQPPAAAASGVSDDDSERESGPRQSQPGSPEPSTGQLEPPETDQVVTPAKESTLPDHLRFD